MFRWFTFCYAAYCSSTELVFGFFCCQFRLFCFLRYYYYLDIQYGCFTPFGFYFLFLIVYMMESHFNEPICNPLVFRMCNLIPL